MVFSTYLPTLYYKNLYVSKLLIDNLKAHVLLLNPPNISIATSAFVTIIHFLLPNSLDLIL